MKDEYDPKDIKYEKVKKIYEAQLAGPTLKKMDASKRILVA